MKATFRATPLLLLLASQIAFAQEGDQEDLNTLEQDLEDMQHIVDDIADIEALLEHEIADRMAEESGHLGIADSNSEQHESDDHFSSDHDEPETSEHEEE